MRISDWIQTCALPSSLVPGTSGSEAEVRENLMQLVGRFENRVAIACFASNVARLETIARVGEAHDRQVALVGRSLWRIYEAAKENGYLTDVPPFVRSEEHTSELQSLMRTSYAVFCLKKK